MWTAQSAALKGLSDMCSSERTGRAQGPVEWLMVGALSVYRYTLSPVFYALGIRCRHEPTCSTYSADAIRAQGAWRGFWLTLGRLGRCRPGGTFGFDPAPQEKTHAPWWAVWAFRPAKGAQDRDTLTAAGTVDGKDE